MGKRIANAVVVLLNVLWV